MAASVSITQYRNLIKFVMRAKSEGINLPLFVWGECGVGKTTNTREVVEDEGMHMEILHAANQSPETLLGLERRDDNTNETVYCPPQWLARGMRSEKRTTFFLDEVNRAPKYVLQSLFSFIAEGHLHTHHIKPDDIIIVAGNPDSSDYEVTALDDDAWYDRFVHIYLEPTITEVETYYRRQEVSPIILDLIKEDPALCSTAVPNKIKVKPSNRMIEKVGLCLNIMTEEDIDSFGYELFAGMLGTELAMMVVKKAKEDIKLVDPKEVLIKGDLSKVRPDRVDMIHALNTTLARLAKDLAKSSPLSEEHNTNLANYMNHIPNDCAIAFIDELKMNGFGAQQVYLMYKTMEEEDQARLQEMLSV
jgi:hypothetical protein